MRGVIDCRVNHFLLVGSGEESKVRSVCFITMAFFSLINCKQGKLFTLFHSTLFYTSSIQAPADNFIRTLSDALNLPAEFWLELLMQSLHFSQASVSDGENSRILSKVMIGGLFLRSMQIWVRWRGPGDGNFYL